MAFQCREPLGPAANGGGDAVVPPPLPAAAAAASASCYLGTAACWLLLLWRRRWQRRLPLLPPGSSSCSPLSSADPLSEHTPNTPGRYVPWWLSVQEFGSGPCRTYIPTELYKALPPTVQVRPLRCVCDTQARLPSPVTPELDSSTVLRFLRSTRPVLPALPALDSPALPGLSSLVRYDMPLNHGVVAAVQLLFRHAAEGVDDYLQPENQLKAARAMFVDQVHPSPATQDAPGPRTPALLSPSLNLRLWPSLLPLCAASPGETAPLPVLFSCARFHTTRRLLSGQAGAAGGRRVRGQQQHYDRGGGRGALAGCQRQALITHSAAHTHTRAMI